MQKVKCEICSECGDGYWAGEHKNMTDHNSFILLCGGEDEPPSSNKRNTSKLSSIAGQLDSWLCFRSKEILAFQGVTGLCGLRPVVFLSLLDTNERNSIDGIRDIKEHN